jgi:hypothetical protein
MDVDSMLRAARELRELGAVSISVGEAGISAVFQSPSGPVSLDNLMEDESDLDELMFASGLRRK